jgi:hypothetical protein
MQLSEEELDEFIQIYKKEYGEDISHAEGRKITFRLLTLYELLARKVPEEQYPTPTSKGVGL